MTTILINDIKQDYKHRAFFSPSSAELEYSTLPREAFGGMGTDAKPEDMTSHEWYEACKRFEKYLYEHRYELGINGAGNGW